MNQVSSNYGEPPRTPPVATDMMDDNPNFSIEFPIMHRGQLQRPTLHISEYLIRSNSPHEKGGWIVIEVETRSSNAMQLIDKINDIFDSEGEFASCTIPSVMELKDPDTTFLLGVNRDSGESVRDLFLRVEEFVAGYISQFDDSSQTPSRQPHAVPATGQDLDTLHHRLQIVLMRELNLRELPSDIVIHLYQVASLLMQRQPGSTGGTDDPDSLDMHSFRRG